MNIQNNKTSFSTAYEWSIFWMIKKILSQRYTYFLPTFMLVLISSWKHLFILFLSIKVMMCFANTQKSLKIHEPLYFCFFFLFLFFCKSVFKLVKQMAFCVWKKLLKIFTSRWRACRLNFILECTFTTK